LTDYFLETKELRACRAGLHKRGNALPPASPLHEKIHHWALF
jgi:hypothetical protein